MTVALRFADFAAGIARDGVPTSAGHAARRCLLDWYGGTLAGGIVAPSTLLAEALAGVQAAEADLQKARRDLERSAPHAGGRFDTALAAIERGTAEIAEAITPEAAEGWS